MIHITYFFEHVCRKSTELFELPFLLMQQRFATGKCITIQNMGTITLVASKLQLHYKRLPHYCCFIKAVLIGSLTEMKYCLI